MLTCSRPLIERRLRPQHDQALKCPRCDSTHTKFCYYNNYSLSQPRYFCKTCRRYWTKGGTLRNIPVGGGCRKNKKVSKKSNDQPINQNPGLSSSSSHSPTDLHLSFPEVQLSHLNNILGTHQGTLANPTFMDSKYNIGMLENPRPLDFMESKLEAIVGSSRNYDFMGNSEIGMVSGLGEMSNHGLPPNFHGLCSPFGMSLDGNNGTIMETYQRLMLPYGHQGNDEQNTIDVKPNTKLLSLEWQDQGGKDTFGYLNNLGSWTGMMNGYGSSTTTNPLVRQSLHHIILAVLLIKRKEEKRMFHLHLFVALVRSICARSTLHEITGSLQVRFFQHDFVPRDPRAKPKKYKYPAFYDPYGPRPPPSDKIIQLAERIAALPPEERRQIGPTLQYKLKHPKLQTISTEGMDLGLQGAPAAGATKVEEKKEKTTFDVKLEKFDAAAKIKVIKEVRGFTNLGLKEAKDLVEKVPVLLKQGVTKEEANGIIEKIKAAGGVAVME
ncbi:hypothetical protein GH714_040707 [Hevea brasiliensis]|uniref:Dof zinc finger protein n=1 Tax=Hevea brasiliensis TaxID=3981 RepID=A0A6A6MPX4_HEVBR|nr:hypothetical protein GH714_040707 [Hevea brasiliensis]